MSEEPIRYPPEAQDFVLETDTVDLSLYTQDPRQLALELAVRSFQPVGASSATVTISDHRDRVIHRADRYLAWLEG